MPPRKASAKADSSSPAKDEDSSRAGPATPAKASAGAATAAKTTAGAAAAAKASAGGKASAVPASVFAPTAESATVNADEERAKLRASIEKELRAELAARAAKRAQMRDECGVCTVKFVAGGTALLPCMDTICRACAEKAVARSKNVQCPECYETHAGIATVADARALPYNPVLEAELVRAATAQGAATHRCSLCEDELPLDEALAVARCEACQPPVLLCTFHVQRHQKLPSTKSHVPVRLADDEVHVASTLTTCQKHHEPLNVHCSSCDVVICYKCTLDGHPAKTHDTVLLDAAFTTQRRGRLADATVVADTQRDELVQAMIASRLWVRASTDGTHSVQAQIQKAFDLIVGLVNKRRAELETAADQHGQAETTRLTEVEGVVLQQWLTLEAPLQLTASVTNEASSPVSLAQLARRLDNRLQALAALPAPAVAPPCVLQLAIDDGPGVERFLAGLGRLVVPAFGPKCTLDVRALDSARVGEALVLKLVCRTAAGDRISSSGATVKVMLRDANESGVAVQPYESEDGMLALAFTPPTLGAYRLDVNVNGGTIPGCPLQFDIVKIKGLYDFTSFTFTNAGVTGARGPTLEQLRAAYGATASWARDPQFLTMNVQGFQLWTVPRTGRYRFTVVGAHGAMGTSAGTGTRGGRGAKIEATAALVQGNQVRILVGQAGSFNSGNGGGGGASVVFHETSNKLLLIAGGGGGARTKAAVDGMDACLAQHGYTSTRGNSNGAQIETGLDNTHHNFEDKGVVTLGHGGLFAEEEYGGGGSGWLSNGQATKSTSEAHALSVSGVGGDANAAACGGFGGGGMDGKHGGGGGGGCTGGNGGWIAGGGGSFSDPSLMDVVTAVDTERSFLKGGTPVHGYVTVRVL